MREKRDRNCREQDEADGEQRNGTAVGPEIAPGGEQRRRVQQRRQNEKEYQFRIEPDFRKLWNQAEQ